MAQKLYTAYSDKLLSYENNVQWVGIFEPGLYRGFDSLVPASVSDTKINLSLNHLLSGIALSSKTPGTFNPKSGVVITPQGFKIHFDEALPISVDKNTGNSFDRYDALILEHFYTAAAGGQPAEIQVIKDVGKNYKQSNLPQPANQILLGIIRLKPEANEGSKVSWRKIKRPHLSNNAHIFTGTEVIANITSCNDLVDNGQYLAYSLTDAPSISGEYILNVFAKETTGDPKIVQEARNVDTDDTYTRHCYLSGSVILWSSWRKFLTLDDLARIDPVGTCKHYTGPLEGNFDSTGWGLGNWVGWQIMNGRNGSEDSRGRIWMGLSNVDSNPYPNDLGQSNDQRNMGHALVQGNLAGKRTITLTENEIPAHSFSLPTAGYASIGGTGNRLIGGATTPPIADTQTPSYGGGNSFEILPPILIMVPVQRITMDTSGNPFNGPTPTFAGGEQCVENEPRTHSLTKRRKQDTNPLSPTYLQWLKADNTYSVNSADGVYFATGSSNLGLCPLPVPAATLIVSKGSSNSHIKARLTKNKMEAFPLYVTFKVFSIMNSSVILGTFTISILANSMDSGEQDLFLSTDMSVGTTHAYPVTDTNPSGYTVNTGGVFSG